MHFWSNKKDIRHMGYRLFIRRAGEEKFKRVGPLFPTAGEGYAHAKLKYPAAQAHVEGLRMDFTPIGFAMLPSSALGVRRKKA